MSTKGKKTVWIFSLASFLHDMGSDMVFSVWPIFVTQVLGANMTTLGFIDGLGDAIVSISQAVSGYWSDRLRKRKIFIWLGYLFGSLSRVGYSLSTTWQWLIPFRILDRSGKMRGSPRDAIVSEVSTDKDRGANFGLLRAMDNSGAVVGVMIALLFLPVIGYRNLFFLAAFPSLLAVVLLLIFIKEAKSEKIKIYKGLNFQNLSGNVFLFTILSALFALGAFSYSFLLLFAKKSGFSVSMITILYLLFTVIAAATSIYFGKLSDRIGRKNVLFLSYGFWGLVSVLFLFVHSALGIVVAFFLYGLHKGAFDPVQRALIAELSPKEYIASTLGGFQMIVGLCALPASLIAGYLWDRFGISSAFYFSLILTICSSSMLLFIREKNT